MDRLLNLLGTLAVAASASVVAFTVSPAQAALICTETNNIVTCIDGQSILTASNLNGALIIDINGPSGVFKVNRLPNGQAMITDGTDVIKIEDKKGILTEKNASP